MEAIDCALALRPDIVLIDPIMQDGYGLQAVERLVSELPGAAIVVLTAFTDTALQMALREMGVTRILTKDLDVPGLISVLKAVAAEHRSGPAVPQPA